MGPTYIIYSLRAQGFVNRNGTYGSQVSEAREFSPAEAIEYCKRARPNDGDSPLIPVDRNLYTEINGVQQ